MNSKEEMKNNNLWCCKVALSAGCLPCLLPIRKNYAGIRIGIQIMQSSYAYTLMGACSS